MANIVALVALLVVSLNQAWAQDSLIATFHRGLNAISVPALGATSLIRDSVDLLRATSASAVIRTVETANGSWKFETCLPNLGATFPIQRNGWKGYLLLMPKTTTVNFATSTTSGTWYMLAADCSYYTTTPTPLVLTDLRGQTVSSFTRPAGIEWEWYDSHLKSIGADGRTCFTYLGPGPNPLCVDIFSGEKTSLSTNLNDLSVNADGTKIVGVRGNWTGGHLEFIVRQIDRQTGQIYTVSPVLLGTTSSPQLRGNIVYALSYPTFADNFRQVYRVYPSLVKLTNEQYGVRDYHVSHDGRQIVYTVNQETEHFNAGMSDLWLMNSDGGNKIRLTENLMIDEKGAFMPGDTGIMFSSDRGGLPGYYVMLLADKSVSPLPLPTDFVFYGFVRR